MPETRRVRLFVTCLVDSLFPEVGEAVLDVLEGQGVQVDFPFEQTCCGQPAYNAGFQDEARALALRFLDAFAPGLEEAPVVCPSGSCAAMIRHGYAELLRDRPEAQARARALAGQTYEFSEYMVDVLGVTQVSLSGTNVNRVIAYHPSCHLLRGLKVDRQPRRLLAELKGVTLVELPEAHECCGFGGLFAVKHADVSGEILKRKLEAIRQSGARFVAGCDLSCLMHIEGGLRREGSRVRCLHLAQLLRGEPNHVPKTYLRRAG